MKIIYNFLIPFPSFAAIMLFGVIFARKKHKPLSWVIINHEEIHHAQAKECGGYWRFYVKYIGQWLKYGYKNAPFEREAYDNQYRMEYLKKRQPFAWRQYER